MHEYSQTAAFIDWRSFPYMYAAADATPLFLLAVTDYVRSSGDVTFLTAHRDAIEKAWTFETGHADTNGIYSNTQGTGWVESWPGGMPHQEIYLALLDQQASAATAELEKLLGSPEKSAAARQRADKIAATIETEYYDPEKSCYAFSRNADGSQDRTSTVYPAMAWWSDLGNKQALAHQEGCLQQFAAHTLATDWGLRDVSTDEKIYDGMSYHQGSVWPLFTGWAALAEYRGGQPLAGYQMLMENANLTRFEDLGADTELLSGDFYVPFGRSTSHQLWSSAMVITPTLRGLFGISIDAQAKTITVNPHLPGTWDYAAVHNLNLQGVDGLLGFKRRDDSWQVFLVSDAEHGWHLRSDIPGSRLEIPRRESEINSRLKNPFEPSLWIPFPAVEIEQNASEASGQFDASSEVRRGAPLPGTRTERCRILRTEYEGRKLTIIAEGPAGAAAIVRVAEHPKIDLKVQTEPLGALAQFPSVGMHHCETGLTCDWTPLTIHFPPGEGWKTITVTLTW
jgi:hypothetical protein